MTSLDGSTSVQRNRQPDALLSADNAVNASQLGRRAGLSLTAPRFVNRTTMTRFQAAFFKTRAMSQPTYPSSRHDRPHARIYDHWLRHPAWQKLSPPAFKIITILMAQYRPANPNLYPVGERRIADLCGCSPYSAKNAINELIKGGFLRVEQKGRSRGNARGRERMASLTRYDTETTTGNPDLPIELWKERNSNAGNLQH